jgi:hypothetical protein
MFEKVIYIVTEIIRNENDKSALAVIQNSSFTFQESNDRFTLGTYYLEVKVLPEVFAKHYSDVERIRGLIQHYFFHSSNIVLSVIDIKPDYDKISILNSEVSIVVTPWEEINNLQRKLIETINASNSSIDFQSIGLIARTTMEKLAKIVFNPEIHIAPKGVDVGGSNYKNQFHTYISSALNGDTNKELRLFAKSAIEFTKDAVDLMNQTIHKLDVQRHFAEVCVISTISVINLIKAVNEF